MRTIVLALLLAIESASPVQGQSENPGPTAAESSYRDAALAFEDLVNQWYAYPERLTGDRFRLTAELQREAGLVASKADLLKFAERALFLLADHHAITNASFAESWAIVPSYADLWIEKRGTRYVVTAVRSESSAKRAGIREGYEIVAINGVPTTRRVAAFWDDLGAVGGDSRDAFAARVLVAGRRDRARVLDIKDGSGAISRHTLPSVYETKSNKPLLDSRSEGAATRIIFNDSLGMRGTISKFDAVMAQIDADRPVILDFTNTPGGGNTSVARALMGWFVTAPTPYQWHELPEEERRTGIPRQWIELVSPRKGKFHRGPVAIEVGRWTGSMGEGLAIGFAALGECVYGSPMAGLLGAIGDFQLGDTSLAVKLPYERLRAVDGTPREDFVPKETCD